MTNKFIIVNVAARQLVGDRQLLIPLQDWEYATKYDTRAEAQAACVPQMEYVISINQLLKGV